MSIDTMNVSLESACGNCLFWMESSKVCRANPPVPIFLGTKQGIAGQEPVVVSFFPPIGSNGWCGRHKINATE